MESIENAMVQQFAKQKMQELLGGGGASSTQDAQSMVINMVKEQFGLGHSDAQKVTHQMTGPAQQELGMGGGGGGGFMSEAASFLGGGGNQAGGRGGGQQGGDMSEAHQVAAQALGGGSFQNEVVEMLMSKFGLAPQQAQGIVNTQQQRMDGAAGGGTGAAGGFASQAEGFLERMTGQ